MTTESPARQIAKKIVNRFELLGWVNPHSPIEYGSAGWALTAIDAVTAIIEAEEDAGNAAKNLGSPATQSQATQGLNASPAPCPITRRPWFMNVEHPELGEVPTYGGPFDSYTVPEVDEDGHLRCERYDHDGGDWVEGGEPLGVYLTTEQPCNHDLPRFIKRHFDPEIACDHYHPSPASVSPDALETELAAIEARVNKAPEGPYFVTFDDAEDCGPHANSGLAKVDTGRSTDWPIARLCEWPTAEFIKHAREDIDRLLELLRARPSVSRDKVLEDAAKACDDLRANRPTTERGLLIATECAAAIRALKENQDADQG